MSRSFTPKVVTANHLMLGDAIWLTEHDTWTRDIDKAELIEDEAHADLRLLFAQAQPQLAVGPYLADAETSDEGPAPVHFRETFRTRGPSNYPHGNRKTPDPIPVLSRTFDASVERISLCITTAILTPPSYASG